MHLVKAKGILSAQNGMNLYRGCSHGCIYCDSRSKCYHLEHTFEDIEVKENALELLEYALRHKRKKCMIGTGSMTDPYIPLEMEIGNVRKALQLIYDYGFGFTVITKSKHILRVLEVLREAGIPTVVWLSPILPFINDTEENITGILDMCIEAKVYGVLCFGMGLTLREGNREYFYQRLDKFFPQLKEKYIQTYGNQYVVESPNNERLMELFYKKCSENGIVHNNEQIFQYLHTFEEKSAAEQLSLWDFAGE